jgi:ABC-2 type transport system permease protein
MILFTFVYVIGGAIDVPHVRYVDYIVPAVLLVGVASGVSYTAFRVNRDIDSGMAARLRTMPIARSAIVGGHVVASVAVNGISVAVTGLIAALIGYRPTASGTAWGISLGLIGLVLVAFTLMGVAFGLIATSAEGSAMFSYAVIGLLLVSSGFVPTSSMPKPVQIFADHQPMTPVIDALRDAQAGLLNSPALWPALAWLTAIIVVFTVVSCAAARRSERSSPPPRPAS